MNFSFNELWVGGFNLSLALIGGGILGLALTVLMARKVIGEINAARSSWATLFKMLVAWTVVPALIIGAGRMIYGEVNHLVTQNVNSTSMMALGEAGSQLTFAVDKMIGLAPSDSGGNYAIPDNSQQALFQLQPLAAPGVTQGPLVNNGQAASFVAQPVNPQANTERTVETAAQAIAAINTIGATPTPVGGGQTYINQFIADNKAVDTAIACNGAYTIKRGDSLAKIARACYGDSSKWRIIWDANRHVISDPNNISVGVTLTIPAGSSTPTGAIVNSQAPATYGQQTTTYTVRPTPAPVYAQQNQQAAVRRDLANNQVVISNNADAVQAIQALGPLPTAAPVVAVAPTPRSVNTYAELKAAQGETIPGGGQAYIDQFLKEQKNTTVAAAGQ